MKVFLVVADVVSLVCVTSCRLNWAQTVVMELCTTDDLLTVVLRAWEQRRPPVVSPSRPAWTNRRTHT